MDHSRVAPECFSCEFFQRADDENALILFQDWGSREAYETDWLYIDAARINANSHLLSRPMETWEVRTVR